MRLNHSAAGPPFFRTLASVFNHMQIRSSHFSRSVIELLAPARDVECARAAIDHGADAIYIGPPQFGARKAASNTMADIESVVAYAHTFGCRVHVALNTLLLDREVAAARRMAWELYRAGVDALIVQDAALLDVASMPPIELHASTQCDNRTAGKVRFWQDLGLRQVVLARELSIEEVSLIASQTTVRLEAFVHGALCVSYSGQCYMSYARGGRSANRGECAQPCRLPYDVLAADGTTLMRRAYPLSLRDNNQTDNLEALIDAGVSSFKIEGRLKDAGYVANVTLHYRLALDEILSRRPDLSRLSRGGVSPVFTPEPCRSFNRGFTDYFAHGRRPDIWQPLTPKSLGQPLGTVVKVAPPDRIVVKTSASVANGDGLCFVSQSQARFAGTSVNGSSPVAGGLALSVQSAKGVVAGDEVFRNSDVAFAAALSHDKTRRSIPLGLRLEYADGAFTLFADDSDGVSSSVSRRIDAQPAKSAEASRGQMERALSKSGGTVFDVTRVVVGPSASRLFVPASELNALRREALEAHAEARVEFFRPSDVVRAECAGALWPARQLAPESNVINAEARRFYESHGAEFGEWGYERRADVPKDWRLMTTRHCIMNAMGKCLRKHPECARLTPLVLRDDDGRTYSVNINCALCQMEIYRRE